MKGYNEIEHLFDLYDSIPFAIVPPGTGKPSERNN
jgi:hypothetical protein